MRAAQAKADIGFESVALIRVVQGLKVGASIFEKGLRGLFLELCFGTFYWDLSVCRIEHISTLAVSYQ